MAPASVSAWVTVQTSLNDELWWESVSQISCFFSKSLLVIGFISVTEINHNRSSELHQLFLHTKEKSDFFFFNATMANSAEETCMTNQIFPNIFRLMECTPCDLFFKKVNAETFSKPILAIFFFSRKSHSVEVSKCSFHLWINLASADSS